MRAARSKSTQSISRIIVATAILVSWSAMSQSARAQDASNKRGFQPGNSYAFGDIETINASNGNLMINFPLGALPAGRNGLAAGINLFYNSKLLDSEVAYFLDDSQTCRKFGGDCPYYKKALLKESVDGGWRLGTTYSLKLIDRHDEWVNIPIDRQPTCDPSSQGYFEMRYRYKLMVVFPDGSSHEMRPNGWSDGNSADLLGDYFDIRPDGLWGGCGSETWYTNNITYYSVDGTYLRLDVLHDSNGGLSSDNPWVLYMPDGSKVTGNQPNAEPQRIYDRNNNYVELAGNQIRDQFNRTVTVSDNWENGNTTITSEGFGTQLVWTVRWKLIRVMKNYLPCPDPMMICHPLTQQPEDFFATKRVVDTITLPVQAGGLSYQFHYNAPDYVSGQPPATSNGWGELSGITVPSGARTDYEYAQDGDHPESYWRDILRNAPISKVLTYDQEYDGVSTEVQERWSYSTSEFGGGSIVGPDGSATAILTFNTNTPSWSSGLTYMTIAPDGTKTETIWAKNSLAASNANMNPYPKTVFTSIKDALGAYVKTSIKDYKYDKNGNVTRVAEYDWVNYEDVPRDGQGMVTGIPGVSPTRVTVNTYFNSTLDAAQIDGSSNVYWSSGSPRVKNAVASTETRKVLAGGVEQALARTQYTYDNPAAPANLVETRSWDSTKGGYSNSLTSSNSIVVSTEYNQYGMPTLTKDPRGTKTLITYGTIGNGSSVFDLYPTLIQTGYQTSVVRKESREYHFNTGLVTKATDVDNGVSTVTVYDVLGRPTLVSVVDDVVEVTQMQTATQYFDNERRVVVRSDLDTAGDGKLVSIQHYDQLGRVRLSRQLEEFSVAGLTDETIGIKVQQRYLINNPCQSSSDPQCLSDNNAVIGSYVLTSNPYRAGTSVAANQESTMGWSRGRSDRTGRMVEKQTFSGSSLPAPWAGNTASTGAVTTDYDAMFTTATDQAGKVRRSKVDGLGRLVRVDEPSAGGTLGSQDAPNQATYYEYDVLGNLTLVTQGIQQRTFNYSSLGRLMRATNPERGTIDYDYYENGSLRTKIDPRDVPDTLTRVTTSYVYDALNRPTSRSYNDGTPSVTYTYDATNVPKSRGRLTSVSSSVSSYSYGEYDALGRIKTGSQTTNGQTYLMSCEYNVAGAIISQKYPSGRIVKTDYDSAGRIAGVKNNTGNYYAGAAATDVSNRLQYSAPGFLQAMKLGNGLWEHTNFNSRLQPVQIGLGSADTNSTILQLDYSYGTTNNNGNVQSQTITVPTVDGVSGFTATQTYTYDSLNRLETARENNGSAWKQNFDYDRYGNRKLISGTTLPDALGPANNPTIKPENNRIDDLVSGQTGVLYDNAGNLTRDTGGRTYQYDAENKMVSFDGGATSSGGAGYSYDGNGQRVKKVVGGPVPATIVFVYDFKGQLIAEYSDSGATGAGVSYVTSDTLGSPRVVTGASQQLKGRHDYLPFGEELFAGTGSRTPQQHFGSDNLRQADNLGQKFTSKERDIETGLDYFKNRYYSSIQGRFTSADPILISKKRLLNPQVWNGYSYVANNPLRFIDPDGLELIKLGDSEQQIKEELKKKKEEKSRINEDKSLSKEERKQSKAALDAQIKTLDRKLEGTAAVNRMLEALDKKGERNGLQLSDFTLNTAGKKDFTGLSASQMKQVDDSQAFVIQDHKTYSGTIYIRTDTSDGFYWKSQYSNDAADYVFYGGSALRHEQVHLQGDTSESNAFTVQLSVWRNLKSYIQNNAVFTQEEKAMMAGIKKGP